MTPAPLPSGRRVALAGAAAALLLSTLLAVAAPTPAAASNCSDGIFYCPDYTTVVVKDLTYPVVGTSTRHRNYGDDRSGHLHAGEDIMAPKMAKLLAVTSGVIVERRWGGGADQGGAGGANSLYLKADDGWYYAYLHINNDTPGTDDGRNLEEHAFAPGIKEGVRVARGQHIAYVGDSGNAESSGSHLHFEMRKPNSNLWYAQPVDPNPSLDAATEASVVPPETFDPWTSPTPMVTRQHTDFLGREPTSAEAVSLVAPMLDGSLSPEVMVALVRNNREAEGRNGALVRLYQAVFLRLPDQAGLDYWLGQLRGGWTIRRTAEHFAGSAEFTDRYGSLDDGAFIDLVYRNVLGREPDIGGRNFWSIKLGSGSITRGRLVLEFSESEEYKAKTWVATHLVVTHSAMLGRMISSSSLVTWVGRVSSGDYTVESLTRQILRSSEYAARVGA